MKVFQFNGGEQGRGFLQSALAEPKQTFDGKYLHRSIFDKAAALWRSLNKNHALVDGNKRLALTSVTVFLMMNGYVFYASQREAVRMALQIARSSHLDVKKLAKWIRKRSIRDDKVSQIIEKGDEQLAFLSEALPYHSRLVDQLNTILIQRGFPAISEE